VKIRLDQVRAEPFHWQETCDVPAASLDRPELQSLSPVSWRGQISFNDPGFLLRGRLGYEQTLTCTRCLKPFVEPVRADLHLLVEVEGPAAGSGEHELHEKDLGVYTVPDEVLETEPMLREQLQLNLPMKPLCRPDCQGLCPRCGADLNLERCDCAPMQDSRWGALAGLRERLQSGEGKGN